MVQVSDSGRTPKTERGRRTRNKLLEAAEIEFGESDDSDDYAVGSAGIREIVGAWIERPRESFAAARYGAVLDDEEQRRRYLIKSLLQREGLSRAAYRAAFGSAVDEDFGVELAQLVEHDLHVEREGTIVPTTRGLEWADAIAPWLYSEAVRAASRDFELR